VATTTNENEFEQQKFAATNFWQLRYTQATSGSRTTPTETVTDPALE
jgi:hypothetical protein